MANSPINVKSPHCIMKLHFKKPPQFQQSYCAQLTITIKSFDLNVMITAYLVNKIDCIITYGLIYFLFQKQLIQIKEQLGRKESQDIIKLREDKQSL